jgi:hypothetical protein
LAAQVVFGSSLTFDQDLKPVAAAIGFSPLAPSLIGLAAVYLRPPSIFCCKRTTTALLQRSAQVFCVAFCTSYAVFQTLTQTSDDDSNPYSVANQPQTE